MGAYDFNTQRYHVDTVIEAMRKELRAIVIDSQTSIDNIKLQIAQTEKTLNQLKATVDNLPDYTAQYNEIMSELDLIKAKLQELIEHPIELGFIEIEEELE